MKIHELAALFPPLERTQLDALADDIKRNGLLQPILLLKGRVIDGKNRLEACKLARVKPTFKKLNVKTDGAAAIVKALNIHRRHLNTSQRAMIAAELSGYIGGAVDEDGGINAPVKESAKELNVSQRLVKKGRVVSKHGTAKLKKDVLKGKLRLGRAEKIARLPKDKQSAAMKSEEQIEKELEKLHATKPRNSLHGSQILAKIEALRETQRARKIDQQALEKNVGTKHKVEAADKLIGAVRKRWPLSERNKVTTVGEMTERFCKLIRDTI